MCAIAADLALGAGSTYPERRAVWPMCSIFTFSSLSCSDRRPLRSRPVYNSINRGTKHCVTRSTFQKRIGFAINRAPTKGGVDGGSTFLAADKNKASRQRKLASHSEDPDNHDRERTH